MTSDIVHLSELAYVPEDVHNISKAVIKTRDFAEDSNPETVHPIVITSNRAVVSQDLDSPQLKPVSSFDKNSNDFEVKMNEIRGELTEFSFRQIPNKGR